MTSTIVIPHPGDTRHLAELVRQIEQVASLYPNELMYEDALRVVAHTPRARAELEPILAAVYGPTYAGDAQ